MARSYLGIAVVAATMISAAWPVASAPANAAAASRLDETSAPAVDESKLLQAAGEAATGGDAEGAVQLYQSAIIYAPADPVPYERLAEFYVHAGQPELAHQFFALALDAQPAYAPALQGLAMLSLAAGDRAGALQQHEVLLRACGATCPETAQVGKALNQGRAP